MERLTFENRLITVSGERKYLTDAETRAFLAAAEAFDFDIRLLCQVLVFSGCRLSEALSLSPNSIDLGSKCINIETLKQRKRGVFRQVPIPQTLITEILNLGFIGRPNHPLWPVHRQTGRRWIQQVMTRANIEGVRATSRGLRHGFAISALQAGIPLTMVSRWMGHSRLETTAIYANAMGDEQINFAARRWRLFELQ